MNKKILLTYFALMLGLLITTPHAFGDLTKQIETFSASLKTLRSKLIDLATTMNDVKKKLSEPTKSKEEVLLENACNTGDLKILTAYPNAIDPAIINKELDTLQSRFLHRAIANRTINADSRLKIISFLLEHGADVNTVNNAQNTPLHIACLEGGNEKIITFLIEKGANLEAINVMAMTPLALATLSNHPEYEQVLTPVKEDCSICGETYNTNSFYKFTFCIHKHCIKCALEMLLRKKFEETVFGCPQCNAGKEKIVPIIDELENLRVSDDQNKEQRINELNIKLKPLLTENKELINKELKNIEKTYKPEYWQNKQWKELEKEVKNNIKTESEKTIKELEPKVQKLRTLIQFIEYKRAGQNWDTNQIIQTIKKTINDLIEELKNTDRYGEIPNLLNEKNRLNQTLSQKEEELETVKTKLDNLAEGADPTNLTAQRKKLEPEIRKANEELTAINENIKEKLVTEQDKEKLEKLTEAEETQKTLNKLNKLRPDYRRNPNDLDKDLPNNPDAEKIEEDAASYHRDWEQEDTKLETAKKVLQSSSL